MADNATGTLADALLDDLDELSDEGDHDNDEDDYDERQQQERAVAGGGGDDDGDDVEDEGPVDDGDGGGRGGGAVKGGDEDAMMMEDDDDEGDDKDNPRGVSSSLLQRDSALRKHLDEIRKLDGGIGHDRNDDNSSNNNNNDDDDDSKKPAAVPSSSSSVPKMPTDVKERERYEHQLIVQSNKHLGRLSNALHRAHSELCTAYKPKFPELEELLPNPLQYKHAIEIIGNETDLTNVQDALGTILNNNQVLTISVSGSTTSGRKLTDEEMQTVHACTASMDEIIQIQKRLSAFVERRMGSLAPNICALVGDSSIAARLLGIAGGMEELSKIPACNIQVLGQVKQTGSSRGGLSSAMTRANEGILAECSLVQQCPKHLQKKALKTLAAKFALAARCDFALITSGKRRHRTSGNGNGANNNNGGDHEDDAASAGRAFRREIETKIEKWQEPEKAPVMKALPKPDLTIKRRRGGRRIRRMKEKYEETALMKQANTRAFSTQTGEYGDDAMGLTMGLLDTDMGAGGAAGSATASLRKRTEKRKMKYANTKASRKRAAQMNAKASSAATSGIASSMVFTPVQGMELVNPDAMKSRVDEANKKWFSENAGFQSALPRK